MKIFGYKLNNSGPFYASISSPSLRKNPIFLPLSFFFPLLKPTIIIINFSSHHRHHPFDHQHHLTISICSSLLDRPSLSTSSLLTDQHHHLSIIFSSTLISSLLRQHLFITTLSRSSCCVCRCPVIVVSRCCCLLLT